MRKLFIFLQVCLSMYAPYLLANELPTKLLSDVEIESVKQQLGTQEFYVSTPYAIGRLSDGSDYLMVLYSATGDKSDTDEQIYSNRCALFKKGKTKLQKLAVTTAIELGGVRSSMNCMIYKGNIIIETGSWSGSSWGANVYKFDKQQGLKFIGYDSYFLITSGANEVAQYIESMSSINLLTNKVIFSAKKGEKLKEWDKNDIARVLIGRVIKPYQYVERKKNFKTIKMSFTDFDESKLYKWIKSQKVCAFYNEDLKYTSCNEY